MFDFWILIPTFWLYQIESRVFTKEIEAQKKKG